LTVRTNDLLAVAPPIGDREGDCGCAGMVDGGTTVSVDSIHCR